MLHILRARRCYVEDENRTSVSSIWPGWFLAIASTIAGRGAHWDNWVYIGLITTGNAAFYGLISLWVLKADVAARGRIGRYFIR